MAHLNEDGLRHLLELIKGKLGEVELASYLTHAMTTIVNKDPDGHAIFKGDKFGFESVHVEGTNEEPSVMIPFYTDSVKLGLTFKFYGDNGEEDTVRLERSTSTDKLHFVSSLAGYKKGILEADVLLSSTGESLTTVLTGFTINPIEMIVGVDDAINLNHPNVLAVRTYVAGPSLPCILLNTTEFIRTGELSNESEDLGSLSEVTINGEYVTNIDGKFFNKCPLLNIRIYGNSQYSSSINELACNAILNTSSREIIVGSCNADLFNLPSDGQPWTLKEYAFCANHGLTHINIADNVVMESNAVYDCICLESITYNGSWTDFLSYTCGGDPTAVFSFSGDRPGITVYTNDGVYNI